MIIFSLLLRIGPSASNLLLVVVIEFRDNNLRTFSLS